MSQTSTVINSTQIALVDRFILTQVAESTLVFPAAWVAEIIRIDRSQILDLPFYHPLLIGIINYQSQVMPLIAAAKFLKTSEPFVIKERLIVIRLNQAAGELANIAVIVDRAIGASTRNELPFELFERSNITSKMVLMCPELIPSNLWQPQRWH